MASGEADFGVQNNFSAPIDAKLVFAGVHHHAIRRFEFIYSSYDEKNFIICFEMQKSDSLEIDQVTVQAVFGFFAVFPANDFTNKISASFFELDDGVHCGGEMVIQVAHVRLHLIIDARKDMIDMPDGSGQ